MSHITIIINRAVPSELTADSEPVTAEVRYVVPHEATEADVGQAVKRLYRQVRDLGS
jgi:hypothetical protein